MTSKHPRQLTRRRIVRGGIRRRGTRPRASAPTDTTDLDDPDLFPLSDDELDALNVHVTPDMQQEVDRFIRRIKRTEAEEIRQAVEWAKKHPNTRTKPLGDDESVFDGHPFQEEMMARRYADRRPSHDRPTRRMTFNAPDPSSATLWNVSLTKGRAPEDFWLLPTKETLIQV